MQGVIRLGMMKSNPMDIFMQTLDRKEFFHMFKE